LIKNTAFILPVILLFTFLVKADVAPDPGYKRVSIDLVIKTDEEFPDYRFFLDFYGDLREIELKNKGETVISPMGGGARYRAGKLLAIPQKSLKDFTGKLSAEQLKALSESIKAKKIDEVTELVGHSFAQDIPVGENPGGLYYVLKREEGKLKLTRFTEEKPKTVAQQLTGNSSVNFVIGGILLTLAVVISGVFAFRKVTKKV